MTEQEPQDRLLLAVRNSRPATHDAALSPTSSDAVKVLERVLEGERPKASRARRGLIRGGIPRIGAFATAAAAVIAAAVLVLSGISGGPSLVDRAYAAINASDQVLHEVDIQTMASPRGFSDRVEGWLLPADGRARLIEISGYSTSRYVTVSEYVITATGDVFSRSCFSRCRSDQIGSFIHGRVGWGLAGRGANGTSLFGPLPGTFANWFKAAYREHAIVEDGTATFDGRRAARFQSMVPTFGSRIVFWRPGTPPPPLARKEGIGGAPYSLVNWYVDPATAQPVGFTASPCAGAAVRSCKRPAFTTQIVTFERLDPTAQNLALLTGPHGPKGAR